MSDLVLQPGSPRISGDGDSRVYTYAYKCARGTGHTHVPGSKHAPNPDGPGFFVDSNVVSDIGYDTVELVYQDPLPETGLAAIKEGKCQPVLRSSVMEKPLCSHPNYKVCWDHYLECKKEDKLVALPSGWDTAANKDAMVGEEKFRWKHKSEAVGTGCVQRTAVKKPELETYYYPAAEVLEKYYYRRKADAARKVRATGKKDTPVETFLLTGIEWMNMGSELSQSGNYWVCSVGFKAAKTWDDDIYAVAT